MTYRHDRRTRGGGAAILVHKRIPCAPLETHDLDIENVTIQLLDVTIIRAAYNQPRHRVTNDELMTLTNGYEVLLKVNINFRHTTWRNHRNNRNDNTLFDFTEDNNMTVFALDGPIHYPVNRMTPTYIDITIAKNITDTINAIATPDLTSDHNPVTFTINHDINNDWDKTIYGYKNCDCRRFRYIMNAEWEVTRDLNTRRDIDETKLRLTQLTKKARNNLITRKPKEDSIPDEILELIRITNRLKKLWQRQRRPLDRLRLKDIQTTIRNRLNDFRKTTWNNKIKNITKK